MLNSVQQCEAKKLLDMLCNDDVMSLARTITNNRICPEGTVEAKEAITTYSMSALELLKRKKVSRDILFTYLVKEGIVIDPHAEKHRIIEAILQYWNKQLGSNQIAAKENQAPPNEVVEVKHMKDVATNDVSSDPGATGSLPNSQAFGEQFVSWFFTMLNNCSSPDQSYGAQHFFPDCSLQLLCVTADGQRRHEHFHPGDIVAKRMAAFVQEEQLQFNPNVSAEGVRCLREAHGLTVVMACGTVHCGQKVVGIFEQKFNLARDLSMENNWRVKTASLLLKVESNMPQVPTLQHGKLMLEEGFGS